MTEWTTISTSDLEAGDPFTATQAQAMYLNPLALAEIDATVKSVPIIVPGAWYPEDGSGGADAIWDHSVDGDTDTITLPAFSGNFEYMLLYEGFVADGTGSGSQVALALNRATSGYTSAQAIEENGVSPYDITVNGMTEILMPRRGGSNVIVLHGSANVTSTLSFSVSAETVIGARLSSPSSTFTAGKVFMFKRRCYY